MRAVVQCCKTKGAFHFLEAVDPVKYNILDYFDIISHPMDLGTIKKKLQHNCYATPQDFVADMTLIWENCIKYNGSDNMVSHCAREL